MKTTPASEFEKPVEIRDSLSFQKTLRLNQIIWNSSNGSFVNTQRDKLRKKSFEMQGYSQRQIKIKIKAFQRQEQGA